MAMARGDGWAVGHIEDMGEGPGFRKVRRELGVTAFGVNAIVVPPGFVANGHWHDEQEEVYFVHSGRMRMRFGDGLAHTVAWYRENTAWWEPIRSGDYRAYYERQYGRSLG